MKISVCMGVYNGKRFIEEQLLSILRQTRQPDEVIICDDGSEDGTADFIVKFIRENGLGQSWKLYRNSENLGYPGNFYHAMEKCATDVVFLSDQDDIWECHKLERMCQTLEQSPEILAVCCKFGLVDEKGQEIRSVMKPAHSSGTKAGRSVSIGDVFYKCEWPGMVLAYRNQWYQERYRQFAAGKKLQIPHDFLVCAWAAEEEGFVQLDEELAWHRRHDSNAGGEEHRLSKLLSRQRKLREIREYNRILDAFAQGEALTTQSGREALEEKRRVMRQRYEALMSGSAGQVLQNAWRNKNSTRLMTAVCDFLIVKKRG